MSERSVSVPEAAAGSAPGAGAPSLLRWVLSGFRAQSLVSLLLLIGIAAGVGYRWSDLVDVNGGMDWLLAGTWVWMAGLLCWRVTARWDLVLLCSGLCGGAVIEWWGTTTSLWRYFTDERPPLWILPAWPIAAISIDRMGVFYQELLRRLEWRRERRFSERGFKIGYWIVLPVFVAGMTHFLWPAIDKPASVVVVAIMVLVTVTGRDHRSDLMLFLAGTSLGVFLEYWGTSRGCWTYYTLQTPPPIAVMAHGFAALAFNRAASVVTSRLGWAGAAAAGPSSAGAQTADPG